MKKLIVILLATVLPLVCLCQEKKQVYTEASNDLIEKVLKVENFKYKKDEFKNGKIGFTVLIHDMPFIVTVTEHTNIDLFIVFNDKFSTTKYILNNWNKRYANIGAFLDDDENIHIVTTIKLFGGVTLKHIASKMELFGAVLNEFHSDILDD